MCFPLKLNSHKKPPHCLVVLRVENDRIVYAHSAEKSNTVGVHNGEIRIIKPGESLDKQLWLEKFNSLSFNPEVGDGVRRLKILYL